VGYIVLRKALLAAEEVSVSSIQSVFGKLQLSLSKKIFLKKKNFRKKRKPKCFVEIKELTKLSDTMNGSNKYG